LEALAENRTLQVLNLSWNNLIENIEWAYKQPRSQFDRNQFLNVSSGGE
jgi:hypothetical protein